MDDENYELCRGIFSTDDLELCKEPSCPALLKSGGAILDVLDIDDDGYAHCQWDGWKDVIVDGEVTKVKEIKTGAFNTLCLYRLIPFVVTERPSSPSRGK